MADTEVPDVDLAGDGVGALNASDDDVASPLDSQAFNVLVEFLRELLPDLQVSAQGCFQNAHDV